ncbi:MAG: dipeptidyl-peptidase 3 family protein [Candidatus Zhuqueibacterota bacterium]
MVKMLRSIFSGIFLLTILLNCEHPMKLKKADIQYVQTQLAKFAPVNIDYDRTILSEKDQQVVDKLVEASKLIDAIFLSQVYSKNETLLASLKKSHDPADAPYLDFFTIMYGPFDRLSENRPFIDSLPKPDGANFYPEDMSKDEFLQWLQNNPHDKEAFESNFTVIRRGDKGLVAVPYSEAYKEKLQACATLLKQAAALSENESLKKFLTSRAEAFLSNDYYQSDMDWMDLDSPIEVVIGPYEVYEDALLGYKAAFEMFLTVADPVESQKLMVITSQLDNMEKNLPYDDIYKNFTRGSSSPIKVVQEILTSGDTRAGVQTLAFNLPNDERVREAKGSKKVMLKNVQEAKFDKILKPIAEQVIDEAQLADVTFEAYFNHILLHEVSHGLGPGFITLPSGEKTTVNKMLAETYSTMEEAKADVCGNFNVQYLIDAGVFPAELEKSLYITYLAGMFRSVRFGIESAHGRANMIQFNYLMEKGAFQFNEATRRFSVDQSKVKDAIKSLANALLTIQARGDYSGAKDFYSRYGTMTDVMASALAGLGHVPVDIKPIYQIEQ